MPVTKKKGAIFEIYADSPPGPAGNTRSAVSVSPTRPSSSASASASSRSRRPLANLPVARPKPLALGEKKPLSRSATADKPAAKKLAVFVDPTETTRKPATRKMDIFVDPTPAPAAISSASTSSSSRRAPPPALSSTKPRRLLDVYVDQPQSQPQAQSSRPAALARKRERARSPDKENSAPGSPAQRTRSKAPLGVSGVLGVSHSNIPSVASSASSGGKKALGAKAPLQPKGQLSTKSRPVLGIMPLADVSVAYEASGAEPEGFRTQRGLRS
jgi:hypothetical protein